MNKIHLVLPEQRRDFFELAAYEMQISFAIIEKDFWVVWVLERLFSVHSKKLLPRLASEIEQSLGRNDGWNVFTDPDDESKQTLLFEYPNITPAGGYIRPFVKIEMGARAEHWPVEAHKVRSYAKEALKEKFDEAEVVVRVLSAERTFWEKATILHQYDHLPEEKILPEQFSRHFYDFFRLLNSTVKEQALQKLELLERVANHKKVYFASGWANYDQARKGTLKLKPLARVRS